ncbi:MAG: glutamine synthetase type III, partial [Elusimicrobiota bacterium]|nr:glutamine synthetase type III [Elusimicrobiota bacterium]
GASANNAIPMSVLNTIVAGQLIATKKDIDAALKKGKTLKEAVLSVLRQYYTDSKAVCFEGNNYSAEWVVEAKKRGLPNETTTPAALKGFALKKSVALFARLGVLTEEEAHSRYHILLEKYAKDIDIEAKLIAEMTTTLFVPAAVEYQNELAKNLAGLSAAGINSPAQASLLRTVSEKVERALVAVDELRLALGKAEAVTDVEDKAFAYCDKVKPYFDKVRVEIDALELLMPAASWPVPKYREMLFLM